MGKPLKIIIFLIAFLLLLPITSLAEQFKVTKVLDGDTIVLDNGERVRLIGIDTTEKSHPLKPIEYFSEKTTQFTKHLLEGKEVRLEYDEEKRDKYGRLLAYVYLADQTFVNAEIIKQGYGFAYTKYPFKYKDLFVSLQKEAKRHKLGYWKDGGKGELTWILKKDRKPFLIYQMSQNLWGVKYNGFIKTRLNNEQITAVLNDLRQWIYEFHQEDLEKQLINSGWESVSEVVSWKKAHKYYGKIVTVEGKVVATHNSGKACFLNFHRNWRKYFTVVIFNSNFHKFKSPPENYYKDKKVRVRGLVREYEGKPEIIVNHPSQIEVIK